MKYKIIATMTTILVIGFTVIALTENKGAIGTTEIKGIVTELVIKLFRSIK